MILDTTRNCANYIKLVSHSPHDVNTVLGGRLPYIRGLAYLQMDEGREAAEFQKLLDHPGIVGNEVTGALSHLQLARAQKMMGNEVAARKSYEDFLRLWKAADSNIAIYQQAKTEYAMLRKNSKSTP